MTTNIKTWYKQTKIGIIPNDWEITKISDLWKICTWKTPPTGNLDNWLVVWWTPFITPSDIKNEAWKYQIKSERYISEKWKHHTTIVPKNSILVTCIASIWKTKLSSQESAFNQQINAIVPNESVSPSFVYYQIIHNKDKLLEYAWKVAVPIINKSVFSWLSLFALPTNSKEQEKIANVLSSVDELIEKTDKIIDIQKKLKEGLLSKLMREGIGHTEFKDSKLAKIPKDWEVSSIENCKDIIWIQDWNHWEIHPKSSDYVPKWIPFIMANCIKNWKVQYENANCISYEQAQKLRIWFAKEWDVLLTHKWTIWEVAIVPCIGDLPYIMLTPQVTYYRFNQNGKLLNQFLFYYFQSKNYQVILEKLAKQSTRNYIWITEQKKMYIPIPNNIEEQRKIIDILTSVDSSIIDEEQYRDSLKILKKWLMDKLLIGEIRVKL